MLRERLPEYYPEEPWSIPDGMTDEEILDHLDSIDWKYKKVLTIAHDQAQIIIPFDYTDSTNSPVILRNQYRNCVSSTFFISRTSETPLITRRGDEIISKFSKPKKDSGNYATAKLFLYGLIGDYAEPSDGYIGDKYFLRFGRGFTKKGEMNTSIVVGSPEPFYVGDINPNLRDYHSLLANFSD